MSLTSAAEPRRRRGQHGANYTAQRRRDTHETRVRLPGTIKQPSYTRAQLARGTDDQGRFIGPRALDRAERYFWADPSRRDARPQWVS